MTEPGWYHAEGDPPGTTRYWDGGQWVGDPVAPPSPASTGDVTPSGRRLASPGSRIGARIIDAIIFAIITFAFLWGAITDMIDGFDALPSDPSDDQVQQVIEDSFDRPGTFMLSGLAIFAYEWLFVAFAGGTPGKLMLGIRISDARTGAVPPNMGQAGLRTANRLIPLLGALGLAGANAASGIGALIGLVSLIMLFADSQHRTVMDRVASTVVVRK